MVSPSRNRAKSSSRRLMKTVNNCKRYLIFVSCFVIIVVFNNMSTETSLSSSSSKSNLSSTTSSSKVNDLKDGGSSHVYESSSSSNTNNNDSNNLRTSSSTSTSTSTSTSNSSSSSSSSSTPAASNPFKSVQEYQDQLITQNKQLCPSSYASSSKIYDLATSQSFGFFNDIPCQTWNRMRQITSKQITHAYPDQPLYRVHIPHSWYQMNYEPNFSCQFEQRVGGNGNGDGPKWICDPHRLVDLSKRRKAARKKSSSSSRGITAASSSSSSSIIKKDAMFILDDDKINSESYLDENSPGCVIYSIGSNGDFQFEEGVQNLLGPETCEIHIFDMGDYENDMPTGLNLHFHHWGITNSQSLSSGSKKPTQAFFEGSIQKKLSRWFGFRQETFKSFEETVKLLGHEHLPAIDILKIDCEGCEWDVYKDWFSSDIPRIGQILVEVHRSPKDKVIGFFDEMYKEGYVTFHKEPNTQYAGGNCVEYAFLKLDREYFEFDN